jgi:hypothetical protein
MSYLRFHPKGRRIEAATEVIFRTSLDHIGQTPDKRISEWPVGYLISQTSA